MVSALDGSALGVGPERQFGVYFLAVVFYLSFAGLVFARLLLYGSRFAEDAR